MLQLYKRYYIPYILSAIVACIGIFFGIVIFDLPPLAVMLAAMAWILLWSVLLNVLAGKTYKNTVIVLRDNCETDKYIQKMEAFYEKHRKSPKLAFFLKMNLFAGYSDKGDMEKAKDLLFDIDPTFADNSVGIWNAVVYYANVCTYFIQINDLKKAEAALESLKGFAEHPKLAPQKREQATEHYTAKSYKLGMQTGNYDGAETYFSDLLAKEKTMIGKVGYTYALAEIHLHNGDTQKAAEALTFVIQNGGDTHYKTDADNLQNTLHVND